MKKFSLLILTLLLAVSFSLHSMTCYANGGSVTVNGASAKAGDEVTVEITASGIKGINAGSIEIISLPDGVTVIGGEWAVDAILADFNVSMKMGVFAFEKNQDIDGTLFKLKLKLEPNAKSGDVVCEFRFKDGSAGNADIEGVQNIPGKLTVLSNDTSSTGSENTNGNTTNGGETAGDNTANSGNSEKNNQTDDVQEPHGDSDGSDISESTSDDDGKKLSPVVIALISVAVIALVAAIVLIVTKKK